jgi:hypothetical protein
MIDSLLLKLFVWISKRWFEAIIFGSDPEEGSTTSIFLFAHKEHAAQAIKVIEKMKGDSNDI